MVGNYGEAMNYLAIDNRFGLWKNLGALIWKSSKEKEKSLRIEISNWVCFVKEYLRSSQLLDLRVCFNVWLYLHLLSNLIVKDLIDFVMTNCKLISCDWCE